MESTLCLHHISIFKDYPVFRFEYRSSCGSKKKGLSEDSPVKSILIIDLETHCYEYRNVPCTVRETKTKFYSLTADCKSCISFNCV